MKCLLNERETIKAVVIKNEKKFFTDMCVNEKRQFLLAELNLRRITTI